MAYSVINLNTCSEITSNNNESMKRLESIYRDEYWLRCMKEIEIAEIDRIYCKHDFVHLMDVARLAYIYSLEEGLQIDKDLIYAAALLHDIGRSEEYTDGIPHDEAGARIAKEILKRSSYSDEEREAIISAVHGHRSHSESIGRLAYVIKRADKESRLCLSCDARDTCKWPDDKKNLNIKY